MSFDETVGEDVVHGSADDAADETADIDEADIVTPEIGGHGEDLGADDGDCYEAAEETTVAVFITN